MKRSVPWRRWLLLLIFVALTILVVTRFAKARDLLAVLANGQWQWVLLATVLHLLYFVLYAALYWFGFAAVGVESTILRLLPVLMASIFVNALAPSGGAGGAALFVDDAIRNGQSGARAAVGVLLVLLVDLGTLIPFVAFSIVFLVRNSLPVHGLAVGASAIFVIFVVGLSVVLLLSHLRPHWVLRLLGWLQRVANRVGRWFRRPRLLPEDWASRNAEEFTDGARAIAQHPKELSLALLWATFLHIVNVVGLYALFLAFSQPIGLSLLLAGFSIGIVFWVIAVIPQGVGAVEGIMGLIFVLMGLDSAKVAAVILSFRGLNFWLPLLVGFIFLNRVVSSGPRRRIPDNERTGENASPQEYDEDSGHSAETG